MKASVYPRVLAGGRVSYRVRWREKGGKQRVLTFQSSVGAERFRRDVEVLGPEEAERILNQIDGATVEKVGPPLRDVATSHVDRLTGVEPGTVGRYRRMIANDLVEIGAMPVETISDTTVSAWVQWLEVERGNSGKTIANKHGFLSAVMGRALRDGLIKKNPCEGTRLPRKDRKHEPVFLTRQQFDALREAAGEHWRPMLTWMVATGMRFGEVTALEYGDIDRVAGTVRIARAWKYTSTGEARLGPPKSRAGRRTINVPASVLELIGTGRQTDLVFTTPTETRVSYPRFYESAWEPAIRKSGVRARPHDLRHTCASWMIAAGVPLPVIQAHLGHESITVTIGTYGHLDRTSHHAASDAIARALA